MIGQGPQIGTNVSRHQRRDNRDNRDKTPLSRLSPSADLVRPQGVGQAGQKGRPFRGPSPLCPGLPVPAVPVIDCIDFAETPVVGAVLVWKGQRYDLIEVNPHTRRDGAATSLLTWLSTCPDCVEPFTIITGLRTSGPNRRCSGCAKPLRPVNRRSRAKSRSAS